MTGPDGEAQIGRIVFAQRRDGSRVVSSDADRGGPPFYEGASSERNMQFANRIDALMAIATERVGAVCVDGSSYIIRVELNGIVREASFPALCSGDGRTRSAISRDELAADATRELDVQDLMCATIRETVAAAGSQPAALSFRLVDCNR